jgi:hypothetical protein
MNTTVITATPVATCAGQTVLLDHLSWPGVQTYSQCPRKFHYRYIVQAPVEFTPASLAFGGAVHRATELLHQANLEGSHAATSATISAAKSSRLGPSLRCKRMLIGGPTCRCPPSATAPRAACRHGGHFADGSLTITVIDRAP